MSFANIKKILVAIILVSSVASAQSTRDPWLEPGYENDPWKLPLGSTAIYDNINEPNWNTLLTGVPGWAGLKVGMGVADPSNPLRNVWRWDGSAWIVHAQIRIPDSVQWVAAKETGASYAGLTVHAGDNPVAVAAADHLTYTDFDNALRYGAGAPSGGVPAHTFKSLTGLTISGANDYDIVLVPEDYTKGFRYRTGINLKGYGWKSLGSPGFGAAASLKHWGSIRLGELTTSYGIKHALAMFVNRDVLNADNAPGGKRWVWPAARCDGGDCPGYDGTGNVYLGSLVALPPSLDLTTFAKAKVAIPGLETAEGLEVARALQDYGAYIVDTGGGGIQFYGDYAVLRDELGGVQADKYKAYKRDLQRLRPILKVIRNSHENGLAPPDNIPPSSGGTLRRPLAPPFAGTGSGLGRSGRWFTYNGQPVYLVGFDTQELAADPSVDYIAALDKFVQYRLSKTRIWIYPYWNTSYLQPWTYSNGKYNLDSWNSAYWTRVKNFVAAAQARNIVVEVTVFGPNNIDAAKQWASTSSRPAWNKAFNTNNVFTANSNGHFSPQFYDLNYAEVSSSGKKLRDYQQALLDKTIAELGGYTNVYFEVANEFPVQNADINSVYPWQLNWANRLNNSTSRLVSAHAHEYVGDHTKGVQYFWDEPSIDVLNFHFYSTDPNRLSSLTHSIQTKGKVISNNEGDDFYADLDGETRFAWGMFLSGGHFGMYEDDSNRIGSAGWIAGAQRLKALRDVAEKVRFWEMSPVDSAGNEYDSLISQGPSGANRQLLANPGSEYVAYFWGTPSTASVKINLPAGSYSYTWYDARNAAPLLGGSVSGASPATIPSPAATVWDGNAGIALVIEASAAPSLDFSLSSSGNIAVTQGNSGSNTITATKIGTAASQPVTFSCQTLPTGSSCSFSPDNTCSPTCSRTLTITSSSTPAGTHAITVKGTGGGLARTTSFTLTVNAASSGTRDPGIWPFVADDPWNAPLGSGAIYAPITEPNWNVSRKWLAANWNAWTIPVWYASASDPEYDIYQSARDVGFRYRIRIPNGAFFSPPCPGGDSHFVVISPDRSTAYEMFGGDNVSRCTLSGGGSVTVHEAVRSHSTKGTYDAVGGTRAYDGSGLGGLIRSEDLLSGQVRHALAGASRGDMLNKRTPRYSSTQLASQGWTYTWVWPARTADSWPPGEHYKGTGNIFFGGRLALPPDYVIPENHHPYAKAVAYALKNYGMIPVDTGGTSGFVLYYAIDGPDGNKALASLSSTERSTVLNQIGSYAKYLQVVTNSHEGGIKPSDWNGVVGGGTPLAPLAPPFAGASQDTAAPAVSISSPLNGASLSGTTTITASASDNIAVDKVEFYIDSLLKNTDFTFPYNYVWDSTTASDGAHAIIAKAYDAAGNVNTHSISVVVDNVPAGTCNTNAVGTNRLIGCFWNGANFNALDGDAPSGPTLTSPVPDSATALDFNWVKDAPNPAVGNDTFSARWKGMFTFKPGTYNFTAGSDDGVRVRIDGVTKINKWLDRSYREDSFTQTFAEQTSVSIEVDYYENGGVARVNLRWSYTPLPGTTPPAVMITHPHNNRIVFGMVRISVLASGSVAVKNVELYIDSLLRSNLMSEPYIYFWNATQEANGTHVIMARAYDVVGNSNAHSIAVTVDDRRRIVDMNEDGKIDMQDVALMILSWKKPGKGDVNRDGVTDLRDVGILLSRWTE